MRSALNLAFGMTSCLSMTIWSAMHVDVVVGAGEREFLFQAGWLACVLFVATVAYLELAFKLEDGSRPGFQGTLAFGSLPAVVKITLAILAGYTLLLFCLGWIVGVADQIPALSGAADRVNRFIVDNHLNGHGGDAQRTLGALGGTALMLSFCFMLTAFLLVGDHRRRYAGFADVGLDVFLAACILVGAGAAAAMGDWLSALLGLIVGSFIWLRAKPKS
jgi:hypothetical protein